MKGNALELQGQDKDRRKQALAAATGAFETAFRDNGLDPGLHVMIKYGFATRKERW
jgi:hypothetical protein